VLVIIVAGFIYMYFKRRQQTSDHGAVELELHDSSAAGEEHGETTEELSPLTSKHAESTFDET
jgi:hypothetical protein